MRHDPENEMRRGGLRSDAGAHAERRNTHPGKDPRVPEEQRVHRVHGARPWRVVRLGAAGTGGAGVRWAGQKEAWMDSRLREQSDWTELGAGDAIDPSVPAGGSGEGGGIPATTISGEVPEARYRVASRSGSGARLAEWAGDGAHHKARARAVRQDGIFPTGRNLGGASVQSATQCGVPEDGGAVGTDAARFGSDRRAAQAGPAGAAGLSAHRQRASRRLGGSQRGLSHQCRRRGDAVAGGGVRGANQRAISAAGTGGDANTSFPSAYWAFTPTTARNM